MNPNQGLDPLHGLWRTFEASGDPGPLASELDRRGEDARAPGCVASLPSMVVLSPERIDVLSRAGIDAIILYGPATCCIDAFLERERENGRNLPVAHWLRCNTGTYLAFGRWALRRYRLPVFRTDDERLPFETLAEAIDRRTQCAVPWGAVSGTFD